MGYRWLRTRKRFCLQAGELRNVELTLGVAALCAAAIFFSPLPALGDFPTEQGIRIQQEALIWTTDYEGLIDGKSGDETINAIKKFQARLGNPATGTLTSPELQTLVKQGYARRAAIGFEQVTDGSAGVSVGIPKNLLPKSKDVAWGTSWSSNKSGLAIDTLRFTNDVSLRALYDKLLGINNRTIGYQRFVDDSWFVIAAFEKGAAIYVRADLVRLKGKPDEIRGFSIWMSANRPHDYQSIAPAMLSSFRSDTDTSHDVLPFKATQGGELVTVAPKGPKIEVKPFRESLQVGPIATPDNRPPSVGNCFSGLGDCPMSIFAFKP